eukprot:1196136-Prorocentrum_minimum.AAC.5
MVSTRRGAPPREPSPTQGEGDQQENLDLQQQVEQLQLQLEEAEAELRVLRGLDSGNTRGKRCHTERSLLKLARRLFFLSAS